MNLLLPPGYFDAAVCGKWPYLSVISDYWTLVWRIGIIDPPPQIRLLTPKTTNKTTTKSKGCAFLEFSHKNALQQALKLHQSELDGRKINVELTAGGGGKSDTRLQKVKERNKGLATQRVRIIFLYIPLQILSSWVIFRKLGQTKSKATRNRTASWVWKATKTLINFRCRWSTTYKAHLVRGRRWGR